MFLITVSAFELGASIGGFGASKVANPPRWHGNPGQHRICGEVNVGQRSGTQVLA